MASAFTTPVVGVWAEIYFDTRWYPQTSKNSHTFLLNLLKPVPLLRLVHVSSHSGLHDAANRFGYG